MSLNDILRGYAGFTQTIIIDEAIRVLYAKAREYEEVNLPYIFHI